MGLIIPKTFIVHMNGRRKNTKITHLAGKTCLYFNGNFLESQFLHPCTASFKPLR